MALICDALAELTTAFNPSLLPKNVVWYLRTPDAAWHLLGQREAAALEHLSKAPNELKRDAYVASFDFGGFTVTVGNSTMSILRKTISKDLSDHVPNHWISSDDDVGYGMVALSAQSAEFADIHAALQRSNATGRRVIQIQRIENRTLFGQYLIQKGKVTRTCPSGHLVERDLFHGTSKANLVRICGEGFDRGRAGESVGAIYGYGTYFSNSFDYSSRRKYARDGHVLYCKVLVGESVQGSQDLCRRDLPCKRRFPGVTYDSAVNNLQSPSIFVIFADINAYPAYLITIAT